MEAMEDITFNNSDHLLNLYGSHFFDKLETEMKIKIPVCLRKMLLINDIDSAIAFSKFDDDCIHTIEIFARNVLTEDMLNDSESLADYLGKFEKCKNKYQISCGQKIILNMITDYCKKLYQTKQQNTVTLNPNLHDYPLAQETSLHEAIKQPTIEADETNFINYIGSLIITVFNDAKRLTLSGWSWPSRHVAADKSHNFRVSGNPLCSPTLNYVTPSQHSSFLNSIVQSDIKNFAYRLSNSLALSLRVDGSVDRTQNHNIYVMGHMVNKDTSISTVFIGFDIPKEGKSLGYFECVKSIVRKVLPWETCLQLITSLVTDGENMNLGPESGLYARIIKENLNSNLRNNPIISIWCVAHRFNLGWKDACEQFPLINNIITDASSLSSYFHKSGERTQKLRNIASAKGLPKPLRYVTYFPVRWTEYVFDLLNVTLRNWRSAMIYFISEKETALEKRWLLYDRIHLITFIADVLQLLKSFQKTFESDTTSLLDIQKKKQNLLDRLQLCLNGAADNGWEQLFLGNIEADSQDDIFFYGHKLLQNSGRSCTTSTCVFDTDIRKSIIRALILRLDERLDYDLHLQENLKPLAALTSTVSQESLKLCHKSIIHDLDENAFYTDYKNAANLLENYDFKDPLDTLQKLQILDPERFLVLKIALARVIAAKPHSADVETLISTYNKVKDTDRTSLSGLSLFNYLYIKVNMTTLDQFDPSDAVQCWMAEKNRRPAESETRKQQEWFKGVFPEANQRNPTIHGGIIRF